MWIDDPLIITNYPTSLSQLLGQSVSYSAISIGPQKEVLYSCRKHQFLGIANA